MSRILIDTHIALWWLSAPERLSETALARLLDTHTEVLFSAVSTTELAVKLAVGKLTLAHSLDELVSGLFHDDGFVGLPFSHEHALELARLPLHHRDPFDRMLVAQARIEGVPLVSADRALERYDVAVLW